MNINIQHRITLFPQPTDMTCWSAAATMLFGDRSVGPGSAKTGVTGGLLSDFNNIQAFASSHGLRFYPLQSWTVEGLAGLLRRGPIWVAGRVPSGHAYVIAGMKSDGTADGTELRVYDPWPPGIGRISTIKYGPFMRQFPMATMYILQRLV